MSLILVLGGYGGFGGRLSRRLAAEGHQVIVAGRTLDRAESFCVGKPRCRPLRLDRNGDIMSALVSERPDIFIDAAGPFQQSSTSVVEACIAARVCYLDLADARDFVTAIAQFDGAAKKAGIAIVSGASSVPALSGAAARHLAKGLDEVGAVEIAISASSKAAAGRSVSEAILGEVGQRLRLWRGGRWDTHSGWHRLKWQDFSLPGGSRIEPRLVALVDVPDLELLPARLAGRPSVIFRAGTESTFANVALWVASWPIKWGWLRSLRPLAPLMWWAQRVTALFGGDRSAMMVRLVGRSGERRLERRWTLIAAEGDGPEIPVLAAAILVARIALGNIPPGAQDAGDLLELHDFEPSFRSLAIEHATLESDRPEPLYRRVMKAEYERLSPIVRAMHSVVGDGGAIGRGTVTRGRNPLARVVATLMRFPPAGDHPLHVHFEEFDGGERWTRDFGGHRFSSALTGQDDALVERFGLLRFHFRLPVDDGGLTMVMTRWSLGPMPLPLFLAPRIKAREWQAEGRFHFDVAIALPLVGRVIHYRGWLAQAASTEPNPASPLRSAPAAG